MSEVTQILSRIEQGDSSAAEQLLPLIYGELRKLAARHMAREKPGHTLDATALVNEAYVRLVGPAHDQQWENRGHFFAAAAEAMRRILVDSARRKARIRHGGGRIRVPLPDQLTGHPDGGQDLVELSDALDQLAAADPKAAELIKLHFFAGLTIEQTAAVLGVSTRKAYNVWAFARAWLFRALGGEASAEH
jgi:RNA polymerase sigma factor (TIGR02999 family)